MRSAADSAGGGDLDELIASLVDLREREAPEGIEDAEAAARALRDVLGDPPQLASTARLDEIGRPKLHATVSIATLYEVTTNTTNNGNLK